MGASWNFPTPAIVVLLHCLAACTAEDSVSVDIVAELATGDEDTATTTTTTTTTTKPRVCPPTHPWVYSPKTGLDRCCKSPNDKSQRREHVGINTRANLNARGARCYNNVQTHCREEYPDGAKGSGCIDYQSAGYFYAVYGCPKDPSFAVFPSQFELAGARCCSDEGNTCVAPDPAPTTPEPSSLVDASADGNLTSTRCKSHRLAEAWSDCEATEGYHLCTWEELETGMCCGTGCDGQIVWSATEKFGVGPPSR